MDRKKILLMCFMLSCLCMTALAQSNPDSADIYFRHLDLNEVVVTGLTGESRLKEMPAPVSIISKTELQSTASTNIIDAIARQPGVSQITTGGAISKPVIRGLGYNRVAVVNDGIRQEGQQWGDEHGIEVDAQTVGQVEILKGPASLMYGSDAMAGVLILHPHKVLSVGQMAANLSTGYQTNNGLFDYSVNFAGNQKGFVWDGRWSQKLAHAYQNRKDGYVPGSQFQERAVHGLLGLNRSWGHSHLTLGYYHLTPGMVEGERDELTGELLSESENVKTYDKALPFQQIYHYKAVCDNSIWIGNGNLKLLVGYQQNQRKEFEESADEAGLDFLLHTLNYDVRYQLETDGGWKLAAGVGGMWQRSLNKGDEYLIPAYRLFDVGEFATASKRWGKWNVTGGVRMDHRWLHSEELIEDDAVRFTDFRRCMNGFSASLGAVYNVTDKLNLRANVSRGFRAPNMSELGSYGVHEGTQRFEVGNHDLKPEHSWQADLGMDFSSRYVSAQVALFAGRISHFIFSRRTDEVLDPECPTYCYDAGNARLLGFEATVDVHPVHRLHFGNTFSYVDAVQLDQPKETKYLPFTPAPRWTSEVKYEITHNGHLFNNAYVALSLECHLRQNHYYMADGTETATPSYTLVHFTAGTDIKVHRRLVASLYLSVNNLFDRAYQSHLSRLKYVGYNARTGERGIFDMGRNLAVRLVVPLSL